MILTRIPKAGLLALGVVLLLVSRSLAGAPTEQVRTTVEKVSSVLNNYRSQFSRIITGSSYHGLVQRLKAKQVDLGGESR